jgi:UDP-glucose 4-epimerase
VSRTRAARRDERSERSPHRLFSTAATYGEPEKQPIEETDPTNPTNPYGQTKLAFEHALRWYERRLSDSLRQPALLHAAGATAHCGEMHNPESHLIPIILQAAAGTREAVEIYGEDYPTRDGTCVRDYIHVVDLAAGAHPRARHPRRAQRDL